MPLPFCVTRVRLLLRDLLVDRDRPDLAALERCEVPERFVWAVLPHAARTFSACIALLPARLARASAVAYLYCRALDSCEDLLPTAAEKIDALDAVCRRVAALAEGAAPPPLPHLERARPSDARDEAHLLLLRHLDRVDAAFARMPDEVRRLVRDLVTRMARGMAEAADAIERQHGTLASSEQLLGYCRAVLGEPVRFAARLVSLTRGTGAELPPELEEDAMRAGEMIQLANVTRDIEKDLRRGLAYHPALRDDLGRDPAVDGALARRVRRVRSELLDLALVRIPSYRRLVLALAPRRPSLVRGSAVLMLLFTDRYFRGCAERAGRRPWGRRRSGLGLIATALGAALSPSMGDRVLDRVERSFLGAARPSRRG